MKLIEQMIKRKLELSEEGFLNKNYMRATWNFYVAYCLALAYLKKDDDESELKISIWKRFLREASMSDSKNFKRLQLHRDIDMVVVVSALDKIKEERDSGVGIGDIYKPGTIGVLSYEYPSDD